MRQPVNIFVCPFYIENDGRIKYALFKKREGEYWEGISGGVEGDETILEAAQRECYEEAGINDNCELMPLDSVASIPANEYDCYLSWGHNVYVVKQFSFSVRLKSKNLIISDEHTNFDWFTYDEAIKRLKWHNHKVPLWELNERLTNKKMSSS